MLVMEEMLTPEDVAKLLKVSEYTVKDMLRKKVIKAGKVGGRWRVKPSDLKDYMDSLSNKDKK